MGFGPPRRGDHVVATLAQNRHGHAAYSARRAGDDHLALIVGGQAVIFQSHQRHHSRQSRRTQYHSLFQTEAIRHRNQPLRFDPCHLGIATPMLFRQFHSRVMSTLSPVLNFGEADSTTVPD